MFKLIKLELVLKVIQQNNNISIIMNYIKEKLKKLSLRSRLIFVISIATIIVMGLGLFFVAISTVNILRSDTEKNATAIAKIISDYMISDLMFKQMSESTSETLQNLQSVSHIENVRIYDFNDDIFAKYNAHSIDSLKIHDFKDITSKFSEGYLHVFQPISYSGQQLGNIYLRVSTAQLRASIQRLLMIISFTSIVLIAISIILAYKLESIISSPILHLAKVAKHISEKGNYNLRVEKIRDDEVGLLYDGFNSMLEQIRNYTIDLKNLYKEVLEKNTEIEDGRNRLQALTDTTPDAVFVHDSNGNIVDINQTTVKMYGYSKSEILNLNVGQISGKKYTLNKVKKYLNQALNWHNPEFEWVGKKKNGEEFPVMVRLRKMHFGDADYVLAMVTDISVSKRTKNQIKQLESYLENIIESMPSSLIGLDENMKITQWNKAAENFLNLDYKEVVGEMLIKVLPLFKRFKQLLDETVKNNEPEYLNREKIIVDGQIYYCNISFFPVIGEKLSGMVIRIDDITEIEQKEQQLEQAQKMETVGTLAGGLAHDFNNVLGGIIGTLSVIQFKIKKHNKMEIGQLNNYLNTIEESANRASELVQQLLTLSRKQETQFAAVDLNEAVGHVKKICQNTLDKSIELQFNYYVNNAIIKADATQIEQVLLNLCVNAAHSMTIMRPHSESWGGKLTIDINKIVSDKKFTKTHPGAQDGFYWKIVVQDEGVGFKQEYQKKIFDPFFTTKAKGEGTGLGLSMVYNIIKQHKGFMDVSSEVDKGSVFTFYLPDIPPEDAKLKFSKEEIDDIEGEGVILVVDDEE
ncbi:MAG: PAS domain S-box protein, partial [Calditrichia bacterium]|nr:PAS domain S-box protein [Calditrichia bacterium]